METLIYAIINGIERLLSVVNSTRKLLFLACILLLFFSSFLGYQLVKSQEVLSEIMSPRIERVGGFCYQQRVRLDSRIVGIQFPIPDYLIDQGVSQNLSALVLKRNLTAKEFDKLCKGLIDEILDPGVELRLLQSNPEWKEKLQDFYKNLNRPTPKILKESEIQVK
jgi:hypothetical protein